MDYRPDDYPLFTDLLSHYLEAQDAAKADMAKNFAAFEKARDALNKAFDRAVA